MGPPPPAAGGRKESSGTSSVVGFLVPAGGISCAFIAQATDSNWLAALTGSCALYAIFSSDHSGDRRAAMGLFCALIFVQVGILITRFLQPTDDFVRVPSMLVSSYLHLCSHVMMWSVLGALAMALPLRPYGWPGLGLSLALHGITSLLCYHRSGEAGFLTLVFPWGAVPALGAALVYERFGNGGGNGGSGSAGSSSDSSSDSSKAR